MTEVTQKKFAEAVSVTISSAHHLYREVDGVIAGLREALAEEPNPLVVRRETRTTPGRGPARLLMRYEYGMLFEPAAATEDDEEEDDVEEADDEVDDEGERPRKGAKEIEADQPLLAVRIALYDPKKSDAFEPCVQYALMSDWTVGGKAQSGQTFVVAGYQVRRVPKALGPNAAAKEGARIVTTAAVKRVVGAAKGLDRRLSCRLPLGIRTMPLYDLSSAEALGALASGMKDMWAEGMTRATR